MTKRRNHHGMDAAALRTLSRPGGGTWLRSGCNQERTLCDRGLAGFGRDRGRSTDATPVPVRPGMVFPVYWLFRDLAGWRDFTVLRWNSSDPKRLVGLALRKDARTRILVANLTADSQDPRLALATSTAEATLNLIGQGSFDPHGSRRASARRNPSTVRTASGICIRLNPYAVVCVDV